MTKHIFISYSKKDAEFVRKLAQDLGNTGFKIWYDTSIQVGSAWRDVILKQLDTAQEVIGVISPDSKASEWVAFETSRAQGKGTPIIPILFKPVDDPPVWAQGLQYINFSNQTYQAAFGALVKRLTPPNPLQDLLEQQVYAYQQTGDLIGEAMLGVLEENFKRLSFSKTARELIQKSREQREQAQRTKKRNQRLLRGGLVVLSVLLVVAIILGGLFLDQKATAQEAATTAQAAAIEAILQESTAQAAATEAIQQKATAQAAEQIAEDKAEEARIQSQVALSRQVALNSILVPDIDLDLKLLLAVQAYTIKDTIEAKSSLFDSLALEPYLVGIKGGTVDYFNIVEDLNNDPRFGPTTWVMSDDDNIKISFPEIMDTPLWGHYEKPHYSNSNQMAAYLICKHSPGGGPECPFYLAVWDTSHTLYEYREDPICQSNPQVDLVGEYLGSGTFRITNESTGKEIGTFLSDEIRVESEQYGNVRVVGLDIDQSNSMLVTAIAHGRHLQNFEIILWDIKTQTEIATLLSQGWDLYSFDKNLAYFAGDDQQVIICGNDSQGPLQLKPVLININPTNLVESACTMAGRNLTEVEWNRFVGQEYEYELTCPQFPAYGYP